MTTGPDEAERVRSYLLSQGERYTFAEIWVRFAKARIALIDSVAGVDQEQADFRPDADEWSISEVLSHVVTSSGTVSEIVDALSRGVTPTPGRIDPPREETSLDINELRERLILDSLRWSALVERLPPAPSTDLTAPHPFLRRASREGMAAVPAHPRHGPRGAGGEEQGGGDWRSRR